MIAPAQKKSGDKVQLKQLTPIANMCLTPSNSHKCLLLTRLLS